MHAHAAGYLSATQSTGTTDFHSLGTSLHGAKHCLFHSPPVGNTALNLLSYCLRYQISIKLRLLNLLDIQLNPFPNKLLKVTPHFINSLPSAPDDDARPGGIDGYRHLICLTLNLHQGDGSIRIPGLNCLAQLQVFPQKLGIMLIGIPLCLPITYNAKPKTHGVNFMSH